MYPDPSTLTEAEILNTTFILDRTDIYRRFRCIAELHTGEKQQNSAKGYFVGREYEVNADNLFKLDVQNFVTKFPQYFYSQKYKLSGKKAKEVKADFPLVFMTPGERTISPLATDRKRSAYEFDFIVFDLMYYDRNNASGNKTSLREKEDIWKDTERIALEILEAYQDNDRNKLYNLCFAGEYLNLPEDITTWSPADLARAEALVKKLMISKNFTCTIVSSIMPFEYKHNKRLAGVHTIVNTEIFTGCIEGDFKQIIC